MNFKSIVRSLIFAISIAFLLGFIKKFSFLKITQYKGCQIQKLNLFYSA